MWPYRLAALQAAWQGFGERAGEADRAALAGFVQAPAHWLDDYALFMVMEKRYSATWTQWPTHLACHDPEALHALRQTAQAELGFWHFVQWRFHVQWHRLRDEAHARAIHIVGDAPIFVAHHSADVWGHR